MLELIAEGCVADLHQQLVSGGLLAGVEAGLLSMHGDPGLVALPGAARAASFLSPLQAGVITPVADQR